MTVCLKNTHGRLQVFVLTHEAYCKALGKCACSVVEGRSARRIPGSLTLATGTETSELPDAVLAVPEVQRAVRDGSLLVVKTPVEADAQPEATARLVEQPIAALAKKKRGEG
jgi:hypothetical protein